MKREFALENIKAIYSPLYRELGAILAISRSFTYLTGYQALPAYEWKRISSEYYYHFIPPNLRRNLDELYTLVEAFDNQILEVSQTIQNLVLKRASDFYAVRITGMLLGGKAEGLVYGGTPLINPLLFGVKPQTVLSSYYPERKDIKIRVVYDQMARSGQTGTVALDNPTDIEKFDKFYKNLMRDVQSLDLVKKQKNIGYYNRGSSSNPRLCFPKD